MGRRRRRRQTSNGEREAPGAPHAERSDGGDEKNSKEKCARGGFGHGGAESGQVQGLHLVRFGGAVVKGCPEPKIFATTEKMEAWNWTKVGVTWRRSGGDFWRRVERFLLA